MPRFIKPKHTDRLNYPLLSKIILPFYHPNNYKISTSGKNRGRYKPPSMRSIAGETGISQTTIKKILDNWGIPYTDTSIADFEIFREQYLLNDKMDV